MRNLKVLAVLALCMAVLFSGCGASNTVKGTAIGVGGGAAVGAGVGALAGNTALGSIIGAAVGGAAGALIGKKMDNQKKELEAAIPEATVESVNDGEALKVTFDSGILFATNSSTVSEASKTALRNFGSSLKGNPDTYIKVIGHTDNTGRVDYNQTLSEKRAQSVYDYLMNQGVRSDRMTYEGKGIHDPVADNSTAEGRSLNRRVEIMIMANEKMIQEAQQGTLR
ncbi:outer membrane protein OmpA-like peptidoglycan-associated protein [Parabacteroides sp. PF5-5]|uniref:OmpA family protein n=1 Tax=unclassified Parabacteroides TaxID=2649774 RepID=UPI0024755407|nr:MULTISPECIES: OmpA family protein [unclassified Parabacteroides]MDH6304559.1 outer membrane protein OmpA-like peptidoglycan-associated protein [Parabacteroides sp. PH5-39]MDH6315828.1 outer membrane protein OmpA-like peptidoglycan-associated protein [Parabacteroides sp. PF5-13]MDH6319487.1 outer membrane protein OmpA-like peptidoglycan-associated protein [Parabacteroides sp. PH5-13]MDH6323218.1 outer membrane protein OmpA-like peptidoglycan-associated protein [Parabacteroides sp. PH5-8]MDH6